MSLGALVSIGALGTNSRALWYLTRGTGLVALVLLTVSMVLGITQAVRFAPHGWPRFVVAALHRNASLLATLFLGIHIVTSVMDAFAPIRLVDVFLPFDSHYRPVWLGLGSVAVDLLVALMITSLVRERLGPRVWRAVHWAAYACWPVAVVHGLGTGTDTELVWVLALNGVCAASVVAAIWWRLSTGWDLRHATGRRVALAATVVIPLAVGVWTVLGPLRPGWARTAGTPSNLLRGAVAPSTGDRRIVSDPSAGPVGRSGDTQRSGVVR